MATSSESSKPTFHLRSISLPSKKHPLITIVEKQSDRLRATEATPSISGNKLGGLKDLHESLDDLLQLLPTQQALSRQNSEKKTEELLAGSLRVLDVCATTRDVISQMKECVQELESSLRRRKGDESSMESEVRAFMVSRKRMTKVVSKCLQNSKKMEKNWKASSSDKDLDLPSVLRQVEETGLEVFESLLSRISPKTRSRTTGWSRVSQLMKSKHVASKEQADVGEVEKMDAELLAFIGKNSSAVKVQTVIEGLKALGSSIQETEEELECVYRRLLKARVSLLNALHH